MKKFATITLLTLAYTLHAFCQNFGTDPRDSTRYVGLRNKLSAASGKEKVDLLNEIGEMSQLIGAGWDTVLIHKKKDTVRYYATQALELATKIGYNDGVALALINLNQHAFVDTMPVVPLRDRDMREKNILRAIKLAEETHNYKILGKGYDALGTLVPYFEEDKNYPDRFQKSEYYHQQAKDTETLAYIYTDASDWYATHGNYEKAFEYAEKGTEYLKYENVKFANLHQDYTQQSLDNLSSLYSNVGDYESAMNCLKKQNKYFEEIKSGWNSYGGIASLFCEMQQYDSALVYWKLWRNAPAFQASARGHHAWGYAILAEIYEANKQYDSAIAIHKNNIEIYKSFGNEFAIAREWGLLGRVYNKKGAYDSAFHFAKKSVTGIEKVNDQLLLMKDYQVLSSVYHNLGKNDSAYKYLLKYITIKDSIDNKQFLLRLYKQKLDAGTQQAKTQLSLLNKDNALKSAQLNRESQQKKFLLLLLSALILAGVFIYRSIFLKRKNERLRLENELTVQRLESENKQVELQRQSAELEMQALRAQMNPHFIFNSLSSINHFILKNESKTASNYLTRFSRLIRMVLINSRKPLISLQDELEMLGIYLEMERLRFKHSFDYFIVSKNEINTENVFVPPLILQPFCENALWHGLAHKEGHGNLTIDLSISNTILECAISDNGIGREKAAVFKSTSPEKEKSMGLQITTQRLALLNQNKNIHTFYTIEDILDEDKNVAGTKVILRISHKELKEELV